ncbi:hypothetical protein ACJW31_12G039200 [Castanea mollissima]
MPFILRRALSLAPLIALRNFTQRRMAKNGQLIVLGHYIYFLKWLVNQVVVGELSHGCVLGMRIGIKAKDVYGLTISGKGYSKHCREGFTKEKEDLEAHLREEMDSKLAKVVEKLEEKFAQKLQSIGIPQQSNIDLAPTDDTSKDEEDNSNNNTKVENNLEGDSEED